LNLALKLCPKHPYLLYNRGVFKAQHSDYQAAIADFSMAIENEPYLAEAYYNRGLCQLYLKHETEAVQDLSKAGEMGLYQAYSLIKRYRK